MMALSILRTTTWTSCVSLAGVFKALPIFGMESVRYASKKAGGNVRNRIGRAKRKYRGIKANDGSFVHEGDILVKQYGLKYYPGENVIMDKNWSLRAAHDGIVILSTEQLSPYPDSPIYAPISSGLVMTKNFFSVIPTPLHGKFKLVSET